MKKIFMIVSMIVMYSNIYGFEAKLGYLINSDILITTIEKNLLCFYTQNKLNEAVFEKKLDEEQLEIYRKEYVAIERQYGENSYYAYKVNSNLNLDRLNYVIVIDENIQEYGKLLKNATEQIKKLKIVSEEFSSFGPDEIDTEIVPGFYQLYPIIYPDGQLLYVNEYHSEEGAGLVLTYFNENELQSHIFIEYIYDLF